MKRGGSERQRPRSPAGAASSAPDAAASPDGQPQQQRQWRLLAVGGALSFAALAASPLLLATSPASPVAPTERSSPPKGAASGEGRLDTSQLPRPPSVLAAGSAALPEFDFAGPGAVARRRLPSFAEELVAEVPKPGVASGGRSFALLRRGASALAAALRRAIDGGALGSDAYGAHADEVDGRPAYEAYLLQRGEPTPLASSIGGEAGLVGELDKQLLPYVRERYNCPHCVACTAFLRRYAPNERRLNPNHFDMEAFSTVVVALSNRSEHEGGLYVQPTPSAASRRLLSMDMGDALVHRYDVNHGVVVGGSGTRHSLVLWVSDSARACSKGTSPWYNGDAERGDADAQWNLGHLFKRGERGFAKSPELAQEWYAKSAAQGHPRAMNNLALLLEDNGDMSNAEAWFRRSAEAGEANGQLNLARVLSAAGDASGAAAWYARAAEQGDPKAFVSMGEFLERQGEPAAAEEWYRRAASEGLAFGPALRALGRLQQAAGAHAEALRWHLLGAEGGEPECMLAAALQYLQGQGVEASLEAARGWLLRAVSTGSLPEAEEMLQLLEGAEG